MEIVSVLLSSYNGGKYLPVQLDSIFQQKKMGSDISVYIRDDGSSDCTRSILIDSYQFKENVVFDKNVGVVASFLKLLCYLDDSSCYIAFSDLDDYWKTNKLERAITTLSSF